MAALREAVLNQKSFGIALTALDGMGGIGKTVLAQALCSDPLVKQRFRDGIAWITIGRESTEDVSTRLRRVAATLGEDLGESQNKDANACASAYRNMIQKKAALVVLDDVWNAADVEPFRADAPNSCLLFTTRDRSLASVLGAEEAQAELLSPDQSLELLKRWARWGAAALPAEAQDLAAQCGRLPLALAMVGAYLRNRPGAWGQALERLRRAELKKVESKLPHYPRSLTGAVELSVNALEARVQQRYLALAVLLEEMPAAPVVQQTLWGVGEEEAAETAERFIDLSLAQREADGRSIKLHDLQLDYVRMCFAEREANEAKEALNLIHGAIRLSSHVITKDPREFASQVVGRLLAHKGLARVADFIALVRKGCPRPNLVPRNASLDSPGGGLIRTLAGHTDWIRAMALSEDGRRALSASDDQTVKVWDVESGCELLTLSGHTRGVIGVALSGDGRRSLSTSDNQTVKVWDLESGCELVTLRIPGVTGVALSGDGRRSLSASDDQTVTVWDLESGRELGSLHVPGVTGVALSGDGSRALASSDDRTVKVWDVESGRELRSLHAPTVTGVALSGDGRRALFASLYDKTVKVWDVESGRELRSLHAPSVTGVALSGDGRRALSSSLYDKTVKVWDVESSPELRTLSGHTGWVIGVALSEGGRRALSASFDRTVKVWDVESGLELGTLSGHEDPVEGVALSGDGRRALSVSLYDQSVKVWDVESGRELRTLSGHTGSVTGVALSGDGRRALSSSDDNTVKVWDVESGRELRTLSGHTDCVTGVALSRDGRRALSSSDDRTVKVWDVESGRELHSLSGHAGRITGVALSRDGRRGLSASWDETVKVWEVESGHELHTLSGHTSFVTGVALSGDGRYALSASFDHALRLWNTESGQVMAIFTCEGQAWCCAFADSDRIAAGDSLGRVYFLELVE